MARRIFILSVLSLAVLLGFGFWYQQGIAKPLDPEAKEKSIFHIEKGSGFLDIAKNLKQEGFIANRWLFVLYVLFRREQSALQAGNYQLSPAMNIREIAKEIVAGRVAQDQITILEGWDLRDIGWYLESRGLFQAEELFELVGFPLVDYSVAKDIPAPKDFSREFDFLKDKPSNVSLEGYLFPDTYRLVKGERLEEVVKRMLENFGKKVNPLRAEIASQGKSIFEIVTMASMLEKEVASFEDRRLVSGILWKRLEAGIPLQVDATISYITGKKTTNISKKETEIDSPYNTYKYPGLPKGPISNPGLESIMAALYPEESDYWYYLSAPDGTTIFSRTLEEHNKAKAKYLR